MGKFERYRHLIKPDMEVYSASFHCENLKTVKIKKVATHATCIIKFGYLNNQFELSSLFEISS